MRGPRSRRRFPLPEADPWIRTARAIQCPRSRGPRGSRCPPAATLPRPGRASLRVNPHSGLPSTRGVRLPQLPPQPRPRRIRPAARPAVKPGRSERPVERTRPRPPEAESQDLHRTAGEDDLNRSPGGATGTPGLAKLRRAARPSVSAAHHHPGPGRAKPKGRTNRRNCPCKLSGSRISSARFRTDKSRASANVSLQSGGFANVHLRFGAALCES